MVINDGNEFESPNKLLENKSNNFRDYFLTIIKLSFREQFIIRDDLRTFYLIFY
jgi:hypothetical protein